MAKRQLRRKLEADFSSELETAALQSAFERIGIASAGIREVVISKARGCAARVIPGHAQEVVVQNVECGRTELEVEPLRQLDCLRNGEVCGLSRLAVQAVALYAEERVSEILRGEIVVDKPMNVAEVDCLRSVRLVYDGWDSGCGNRCDPSYRVERSTRVVENRPAGIRCRPQDAGGITQSRAGTLVLDRCVRLTG